MNIGERIKRRREELDMSQAELARKVGYSTRSTIDPNKSVKSLEFQRQHAQRVENTRVR